MKLDLQTDPAAEDHATVYTFLQNSLHTQMNENGSAKKRRRRDTGGGEKKKKDLKGIIASLSLLEEQEKQDERDHDRASNDDASLIEETHKERNKAMLEYYSDLQECYSEVEESETMKRRKSRSAACAVVVTAAVSAEADGVEKGKPGVGSGHHRRLWVKDRSKAWWDECNQPDFPDSEFKKAFRMGKSTFDLICEELNSAIAKEDTTLRNAIPVRQRVAVCLWRLATGDPLRLVSKRFGLGISTCHKLVLEVCSAIRTVLMPKYLQWPEESAARKIKDEFEGISGIPNVAGSMYTTHIPIIAPKVSVAAYFNKRHTERNQKTSYSITVQGVVDPKGVFTDVCIGWPGSMPDDQVLEKSALNQRANNGLLKNVWIVGGAGYPLMDWVLVPYTQQNLTWTQHAFNEKIGGVPLHIWPLIFSFSLHSLFPLLLSSISELRLNLRKSQSSQKAGEKKQGFVAMDATTLNSERRPFSIKLWPPSQNTRKVLVERMINNLSSKSLFTEKYGCLSKEEAEENAKQIEDVAFATADQNYENEPDGDGSSAVQLYARECSKLLLEVLKKGPRSKEDGKVTSGTTPTETLFDISKAQRAFIEAEEAEELLKSLKEPGNTYTKICFSNRSFGLGAARVAEPILVSLKNQLKEVDLSDFIAGRPEAEALEVMNIFAAALEGSVLKYLNLSNNALGEKGVRAFGALLKSQSYLEELYLMNDGISEEAARAVCELIPSTEKLRVLHFHNNMTGDEGAIAIAEVVKRSPLLNNFRCSSTRVGSEGGVALSEALGTCTHLEKLDLRDNMFGVEGGVALSKALSKHDNLTEIYLSYLNLEDEGAVAIANVLKESAPALEVLDIAGNDITAKAAPAIAACIAAKPHLAKLNLGENSLKDEGTIQISKVLEGHAELQEVDFNTNQIRRAGARALAQAVVQKPGFKLLNINANFISDEGIDELKDAFKKSPNLLGSLDENDPEGEDDDDEDEDDDKESGEGEGNEDELESKLKNLEVGQEE